MSFTRVSRSRNVSCSERFWVFEYLMLILYSFESVSFVTLTVREHKVFVQLNCKDRKRNIFYTLEHVYWNIKRNIKLEKIFPYHCIYYSIRINKTEQSLHRMYIKGWWWNYLITCNAIKFIQWSYLVKSIYIASIAKLTFIYR